MGVRGAWPFVSERARHRVNVIGDMQGFFDGKEQGKEGVIHIDIVGAFYTSIRQHFLRCNENEHAKKSAAANRVLADIATVVNKNQVILYIDGQPTQERHVAHDKRLKRLKSTQDNIEGVLSLFLKGRTKKRHQVLNQLLPRIFRVTNDVEAIIYETAKEKGWNVVKASGEAEVEIARVGGIVLTEDSDMLFYKSIDTVICPFDGFFKVYKKEDILSCLRISHDAFTAMGIVASNDYTNDFYASPSTDASLAQLEQDYHKNRLKTIYETILQLQLDYDSVCKRKAYSIEVFLKDYIEWMNTKTCQCVIYEDYENSYNIFALQKETLLPDQYDSRSLEINRPAVYYDKMLWAYSKN